MEASAIDHQRISREDRLRIRRIVETQEPLSDEDWKKQVEAHSKAGRDTASALPFWKRWMNCLH